MIKVTIGKVAALVRHSEKYGNDVQIQMRWATAQSSIGSLISSHHINQCCSAHSCVAAPNDASAMMLYLQRCIRCRFSACASLELHSGPARVAAAAVSSTASS
jgi:hypothetical protein